MDRWKKLNNEGFSIVEAMVAIVILSIIFIPITNTFISSIKASRETKIMQEATSTAQLAMEEAKKKSFEELENIYTFTEGDLTTDTWDELKMNKVVTKAESGCCDFEVDVEISKTSKAATTTGINSINNTEMKKIYSLEASSSEKIVVPKTQNWIIDNLALKAGASKSDVASGVKRYIYINLKTDTATGNTRIYGKVDYHYDTSMVNGQTFDETLASKVKNIFLYYIAEYDNQRDKLIFQNSDRLEGNLYIVGEGADDTIESYDLELGTCDHIEDFNVITTVAVYGHYSVTNEDAYVPDKEKETRRYEVSVTVKKKSNNEVYSSMVSTRGE